MQSIAFNHILNTATVEMIAGMGLELAAIPPANLNESPLPAAEPPYTSLNDIQCVDSFSHPGMDRP